MAIAIYDNNHERVQGCFGYGVRNERRKMILDFAT